MPAYWKNQYQRNGAVEVSPAIEGGPEVPGVSGLPAVSRLSSQDEQGVSARKGGGAESAGRNCPPEAGSEENGSPFLADAHVHASEPDQLCDSPDCNVETRECRWCGIHFAVEDADLSGYCSRECYEGPFL